MAGARTNTPKAKSSVAKPFSKSGADQPSPVVAVVLK
jgi:hypothetical protein